MTVQQTIETKLAAQLDLAHLQVINESSNHNVPPGSESHFKVVLVAGQFAGKLLLERHRLVNTILAEELARGVHALAIHAYTEPEWHDKQGNAPLSPPCHGGEKAAP